jgi:nucleotide-binding universal stress UspA family protein
MKEQMRILIGYDGSACADAAIDDLRRAGLPEQVTATVLSVVESWLLPPSSVDLMEGTDGLVQTTATARRGVARISAWMPEWKVEPEIAIGSPASAMIEKADTWKPHLIVVGSHGRTAAGRFVFGSVSQNLVHEAHCTVRVARSRPEPPTRAPRIIIGVDGSKGAEAAINAVVARDWPIGSEVRLINGCWKIPMATSQHALSQIAAWVESERAKVRKMTDEAVKKLGQAGLKTTVVVKEEDPKVLLLAEAESWDADCIFVGAKGIGRVERFLVGSVSSAVAARAHCSVEIVRTA